MNRKTRLSATLLVLVAIVAATVQIAVASPSARMQRLTRHRDIGQRVVVVESMAKTATMVKAPRSLRSVSEPLATAVASPGEVVLPDVPAYTWRDGCGPTALGMVIGYWDAHGCPDLVPGDASVENEATAQMIASHGTEDTPGHYEDYSMPMDQAGLALDRSELPLGDEHPSDSVADFMHTSWSHEGMMYGGSWASMMCPAFDDYVRSRHPESTPISAMYPSTLLTWSLVKAEIDAGRPLVFMVDATADTRADHTVAVLGYRETNGFPEFACWDTWNTTEVRWSQFRPMSTTYGFGVWGGWTFDITSVIPEPDPTPTPTPSPSPTSPADTTPPVTDVIGADDAWHATSVALSFSASDFESGVATTEYSVDGGPWVTGTSVKLTLGKRAGNSGVHTVGYRSADLAGNVEAARYAQVKLDGLCPSTASNADGVAHSGSFDLVLTPYDKLSGVADTFYAVDSRTTYRSGTRVTITKSGAHTVRFYSVDVAGNIETLRTCKVTIM